MLPLPDKTGYPVFGYGIVLYKNYKTLKTFVCIVPTKKEEGIKMQFELGVFPGEIMDYTVPLPSCTICANRYALVYTYIPNAYFEYMNSYQFLTGKDTTGKDVYCCVHCANLHKCYKCETVYSSTLANRIAYSHNGWCTEKVCDSCLESEIDNEEDTLIKCEDCDTFYPTSHFEESGVNNRQLTRCQSCCDNYYTCDGCGDEVHSDDTYYTDRREGNTYCESCGEDIDRQYTCENCGGTVTLDEEILSDSNGCRYCAECYNDIYEEEDSQENEEEELGYSKLRNPKFYGNPDREDNKPDSTVIYHGFEIERECKKGIIVSLSDYASEVKANNPDKWIHCTTDGTIRYGIEFVSNPSTFEFMSDNIAGFMKSINAGTEYGSDCGIHLSASKSPMTNLQIAKIVVFVNSMENRKIIEKVAGRTSNTWCTYHDEKCASIIEDTGNVFRNVGKYEAVNVTNHNHIEFRIFNTTKTTSVFLRYLQFVNSVCLYFADENQDSSVWTNMELYLQFLQDNKEKYGILLEFIEGIE